ncbi:MAG: efflux transporter outer membrane subunit [Candidatus Thiodiazotropha sp. (ex Rostrolucina anterorostrata)]|nr:efflux transporter outer membrane subunit [Candidatus Thiodiazotropha sp. (ex Rostrolucina anterorostrata)]
MRKLLYAGIAICMLSSCVISPDYLRPTIETPASWTISYAAAAGMIDSAWWEQFNDPVLNELIATALTDNLDLMAATARVDQFLGQWRTTRSEAFPQIGASAGISRQQDTKTGLTPGRNPYNAYSGAVQASWEIDFWGRIRRATEAAQAELIASEAGRRTILLTLVSNVANNYIVLRGLDRQLEIAKETEQAYADSLHIFNLRHKYGTVSLVEVSQVESEYEDARQLIPLLEGQISQQEHLIAVLLGQNPKAILRGKTIDELTIPGIPAELPSQLLQQRPDIIAAEQALIAANARIGVARALYYPNVSLTGALGISTINSGDLFDGDSFTWGIGGDVLAPIFTFGNIEGQVMTAEALQREALYNYRQSIISAFRDVEDALVATTKGRKSQEAQGRRVKALSTYSRLAKAQYDMGTTSYLQVLDANRSLFSSELDYVQTQTTVMISLVDIYRSMGGGWLDIAEQGTANDTRISIKDES